MKMCNSQFIIKYHDSFKNDNYFAIIMEYIDGITLRDAINKNKQSNLLFSKSELLHIFSQMLYGVFYLHSNNILHGDLKPEVYYFIIQNILLSNDGRVKICDFGISKIINCYDQNNTIKGTPLYMAPEIINKKIYNLKADIYSLGVILYEMMSLKTPYDGEDLSSLIYHVNNFEYDPLLSNSDDSLKILDEKLLYKKARVYIIYIQKRPDINSILKNTIILETLQKLNIIDRIIQCD